MVRATFAGFQTALTSLQANSRKLDVTSQNLANMNVEGYTRQQLRTSSLNYENPVSFYMNENDVNVGYGVAMDGVMQIRDEFMDIQYRDQNTATEYNSTIEYSLNTLARFMDESNHDSIRASLDNIQKALTTMQDSSKVQDPVYEGQLQSDMNATAVLLNSAAKQIKTAEDNEFEKLSGEGTSSRGAIENINTLLREIGELNDKIKHNQLLGNSALELQDERNMKIDELSGYIPITVEYYSEKYTVTVNGQNEERYRIYTYDKSGNICGRSDWPEDLRITLDYTKKDGTQDSIILVNGTYKDASDRNYGSVDLAPNTSTTPASKYTKWSSTDSNASGPLDTQLVFSSTKTNKDGVKVSATNVTTANSSSSPTSEHVTFSGGSVQASLDMLAKSSPSGTATSGLKQGTYYGYDYYMDELDNFARTLAQEMNLYNYKGNTWDYPNESEAAATTTATNKIKAGTSDYMLFVNRDTQTARSETTTDPISGRILTTGEITAENISLSTKWVNGTTKIGLKGESSNQTVLDMLESFTQPHKALGDKTYANYMNSLSTKLANDQENNKDALDTNKTVLTSITSAKDQLSGVSLDEEAANMMTYVSSYNAAAKVITAYDETIRSLLALI
ncbi:flagellar hook-associated protein [Lachnospiraceae bacterium JC7]|nr:flagellar hook-associated protein [Lachnospiraceae bacterium JC7]